MAAVAVAIAAMGEPPGARGVDDAQYVTLLDGGLGADRHQRMLPAGWLFGELILAAGAVLLAWGYRRNGRLGRIGWALLAVFILQAACLAVVMVAYATTMGDPSPPLWGALPVPSAWLVYLFWPGQFAFVILYVATFDRWFWTAADETRFQEILRGNGEAGAP